MRMCARIRPYKKAKSKKSTKREECKLKKSKQKRKIRFLFNGVISVFDTRIYTHFPEWKCINVFLFSEPNIQ